MRGRRKTNKKGMSLVELIAVMVISVVVVGAALVALTSGSRGAADGSADYANHGDAHLLETWLRDNLPTANSAAVQDKIGSGAGTYSLFFTDDGNFEIANNGKSYMQIGGIQSFAASTEKVGQNQTFHYEIGAAGGGRTFALSGGVVLNNIQASGDPSTRIKLTIRPTDAKKQYIIIGK